MNSFLPHTPGDVEAMLAAVGAPTIDALFAHVPKHLRERARHIAVGPAASETDVRRRFGRMGAMSARVAPERVFMGAGAYPHQIPAVVDHLLQRSEFATAYTPYQPEVSQGTLQAIFEYQTFVATLMGLDVANASMYDGASAAAEAVLMARRLRPGRETILVSRAIHPHYRDVVQTYVRALGDVRVVELPWGRDGRLDPDAVRKVANGQTLCAVIGYPNVFGIVEDLASIAPIVVEAGGLVVSVTTEPLALAAMRSPGGSGVDIAVAEGQSFGMPLSYGGPGVGLFATRDQLVRAMPGRLVGETTDTRGQRGYVLTLATREQHIRRERATSNICTNQGLCSLAVTVYLSLLGRRGLQDLARVNRDRAAAVRAIYEANGFRPRFDAPTFNEFVVDAPGITTNWGEWTERHGLIPGFPLDRWFPELAGALLVCATEVHGAAELAALGQALEATARQHGR